MPLQQMGEFKGSGGGAGHIVYNYVWIVLILARTGWKFSLTFVFGQVERLDSVENLRIGAAAGDDW